MHDYVLIYVNGRRHEVRGREVFQPLSDFLRYRLNTVGTKVVCAEGDCGACTVMLGRPVDGRVNYQIVNSCIQYIYQLDCTHIVTVEGLCTNDELTVVQQAMVEKHGSQCGYCTPGFVVAMADACQRGEPSRKDVQEALVGNLCRCTGYLPIMEAGVGAGAGGIGGRIAERYGSGQMARELEAKAGEAVLGEFEDDGKAHKFFKPATVAEAVKFKAENPGLMVIAGGTDLGVRMNKGLLEPAVVMSLSALPGLGEVSAKDGVLSAGAGATWTAVEAFVRARVPEFYKIMVLFGSPQIRNAGTIGGNIANASPIADSLPFLYVMEAEVELVGVSGTRRVRIDRFYKGYKQLDLHPDELIAAVHVPLPKDDEVLKLYKVSKRRHMDISSFTAAVWMKVDDETVESARIAYGGVAPVVLRLPKTEAFVAGKELSEEVMREAGKIAAGEISPISDVRGSKAYRSQLAENALVKFYFDCAEADLLATS